MPFTEEEKKQRAREATKRWRENNRDRSRELDRGYYRKSSEEKIAKVNKWRAENPERYKENHKRFRERNRERINARQRDLHFNRLYGINRDDIPLIIIKQGGCAACKTKDPGERGWAVDHCHNSNEYRGILCHPCNLALGLVEDSVDRLKALITYLER